MDREQILNKIRHLKCCDLLVIGGGATGCGIAVDAASRGLKVVLAEMQDFAEGTSGRSSKLVHGGVRYLEMAVKQFDREQYQLVKEGLHERFYFLRNVPHLSHILPLISPVYRWWRLPYMWLGLQLYDLLAGRHGLGPSGFSAAEKTLAECPLLNSRQLKGGIRYFDGQFNDSRVALALALTAAEQGALAANHLAVAELLKENGKICGAVLEDRLTGERLSLRARTVVNATGPFGDAVRHLDRPDAEPLLTVSSGVHIVLDDSYRPPKAGLLLSETEDGRVLFLLPWQGRCLVGTTDRPAQLEAHPLPTDEDIDYLLRHLAKVLDPPPSRQNLRAAWSGLRPLVRDPQAGSTARLLRDFIIEKSPAGLYSILGGKWTSYRRMAEQLVDRLIEENGFVAESCRTTDLPLHGAQGWQPLGWQQLARDYRLSEGVARHLHENYGCHAAKVAELMDESDELAQPLTAGFPCLMAEVVYACRFELAERAGDVLARRLPLALLDSAVALEVAPRVLALMAREQRWNNERLAAETALLKERLQIAL